MSSLIKSRMFALACLLLLAGSLRFYKLGAWPFANDELHTQREEKALFLGEVSGVDSQIARLPRATPWPIWFNISTACSSDMTSSAAES